MMPIVFTLLPFAPFNIVYGEHILSPTNFSRPRLIWRHGCCWRPNYTVDDMPHINHSGYVTKI
jgi:hypothetical protein